jgi:hypothetical protein
MRIQKTLIIFEGDGAGDQRLCDTIEHESRRWLVTAWIAEVLANGTAIAQIMMLGQIPPEQLIVRLLGADHLDLQGLE